MCIGGICLSSCLIYNAYNIVYNVVFDIPAVKELPGFRILEGLTVNSLRGAKVNDGFLILFPFV